MYSNNFDSTTNNLRNSANGTFVTSDDTFPLTVTAETKYHSEKRSLTDGQNVWVLYDFFEISKKNEEILDVFIANRSSTKEHKVGRSITNNHWQTYWQNTWRVDTSCKLKSGRWTNDIRQKKMWLMQIEIYDPKTSRAESEGFSLQREKSDRPAIGALKKKRKRTCWTQLRNKRLHTLNHDRLMFSWRPVRAQARPEQERQKEGTTFTFPDRFTAPKFEKWRNR